MRVIGLLVRYSLILLILSNVLFAKSFPNKTVDNIIRIGVDYLLRQNYDAAKSKFSELNRQFPNIPLGKIYLAAADIAEAVDYGEQFDEKYINILLSSAKKLSDSLYNADNNNLWNNYYMAISNGFYAGFKGLNGDYFSAITNGLSSISYYEKCLDIDSLFYDSYVALGSYYYWKSAKTKSLTWLPFISDDRELGRRLLEKAMNKNTYTHFLAAYSLIWIYIERKEFQNAISVCNDILIKYPNNRLCKLSLARIYVDVDKYKAIRLYKEVLISLNTLKRNNHLNEIEIKHKIAMQYTALENYTKAKEYCDDILGIDNLNSYVIDQLGDRLDRVKNLKREIIENLKK
ncbi:MAG: hypothetical protein V1773_00115 [bacterium]